MRARMPAWMSLWLLWMAMPSPSEGQALDWLAEQAGFEVSAGPDSPRLEGMGGLSISVPDEGRELNLSDFGRNLAGLLEDSDGRRWDGWSRSRSLRLDHYDETGTRVRTRRSLSEAGARVTWRNAGTTRMIGLDYSLARFENDVERGDGNKSSGPIWGGFAGQKVGPLTLAGSLHFTSDNEDLDTRDVFAVRHEGGGVRYLGAIAYSSRYLEAGIEAEHQVNTIDGVSRDESRFHEDALVWKRPVRIYSGSLLLAPTSALRGGARARILRIDGAEEADISWSDRMPQNPGQQNFRTLAGTFEEKIRGVDLGTRWSLDASQGFKVSVELEWGSLDTDVNEGANFKGSRRALDLERTSLAATAGTGATLMEDRLRLGVEGLLHRQVDKERRFAGPSEVTSREIGLRVGGEYYVSEMVALRVGLLRTAVDADLDQPRTLRVGNGFTLGIGLLPRGGLIQLDAGFRFHELNADYGGDPRFEEVRTAAHLGARMLL